MSILNKVIKDIGGGAYSGSPKQPFEVEAVPGKPNQFRVKWNEKPEDLELKVIEGKPRVPDLTGLRKPNLV